MSDALIPQAPARRRAGARMVLGSALLCAVQGCAIYGQIQDNDATRDRVSQKTTEVDREQSNQRELDAQMHALSDELATTQLTASQLEERLDALLQRNRALAQSNGQKRRQRDALAHDLNDYRVQAKSLRAAMAATSAADKARYAAQQKQLVDLQARVHVRLTAIEKSNE